MRRTFQPSRHSVSYGDAVGVGGSKITPYQSGPWRYYEADDAGALLGAMGFDPTVRLSKSTGTYYNWDMILLARDRDRPAYAKFLLWATGSDIAPVVKNVSWDLAKSVEATKVWAEGMDPSLPYAHYNLRNAVSGRSRPGTAADSNPSSDSGSGSGSGGGSSLISDDSALQGGSGGGSSFPWLPVIGGSVLVLGLGVGGYIFYKRRKTA